MRNTKQQELIYSIVQDSCEHPSAEKVFEEARLTMPKISLGTVYRVLKNLAESGKIKRIVTAGEDRFDKTTFAHAHFVCDICGCVSDVPFDIGEELINNLTQVSGNRITHCDAMLHGICKACANKQK